MSTTLNDRANILVGAGDIIVDGVTLGGTVGGVTMTPGREIYEKEVDQVLDAVAITYIKHSIEVETSLSEATLGNLRLAMDQEAALEGGGKILQLGLRQAPAERLLVFNGPNPLGTDRTATFYRAVLVEGGTHSIVKDGQQVFPVKFRCLPDLSKAAGKQYGNIEDA